MRFNTHAINSYLQIGGYSRNFASGLKNKLKFSLLLTSLCFIFGMSFSSSTYAQTVTVCGFEVTTEVIYNSPQTGQTTFRWTVINKSSAHDLSHFSQKFDICVDPDKRLSGGTYGNDPSCNLTNVLKFDYGTGGSAPVIYEAVFEGTSYAPVLVDGYFKAGNNCCTGQIWGVGCCVVNPGSIAGTDPVCYGGNPGILGSTTNATGNGNITYQWQSNTTGCNSTFTDIQGATNATYDPPAGITQTTYYRRVATNTLANNSSCSDNSNCVSVTVNPLPTVTADDKEVCQGNNSVALTGTPSGGTWSSLDAPNAISGSTFNANGLQPGSYTVTYRYTDGNTCSNTDDAEVVVLASPTANPSATVECVNGVSTATILANASGGSGTGYSYIWTVPAGVTNPGNVASFSTTVPGTYSVVVTDSRTCSGSGDITPVFGTCDVSEGCTPGYWKNHPGAWITTGFSPNQTLESVFDVPDVYGLDNFKLIEALDFKGGTSAKGAAMNLLRAAVAALLNAASSDVDYPRTTEDIIRDVNAALATGSRSVMLALAKELDDDNNLGCPLDNSYEKVITRTQELNTANPQLSKMIVLASPNPYNDKVRFVIQPPSDGRASLEIFNMLGQKVSTLFQGEVKAGVKQTFEYAVPEIHRTNLIYLYRLGNEVVTGKLLQGKQ